MFPDGGGLIGTVDAVQRVAKIKSPRAERIARTTGHEARQVGLALDHLRRRNQSGHSFIREMRSTPDQVKPCRPTPMP